MKKNLLHLLFALVLGALVFTLVTTTALAASSAVPAGPPARPAVGPAPDSSLAVHALNFAPGPLDNPIKGFAPFFFKATNYEQKPLPHSLIWSYFALSEVQNNASDCNSFNWDILEQMLDETASTGRQAMIRFYVEYPGGTGSHPGNGVPPCVNGKVAMRSNGFWGTVSPDYDDPDMIDAFAKFTAAFGARYDGDPRIGIIHMGLVGLWGEWHTWPYDRDLADGYPNLFPTDATLCSIINTYDAAFSQTQLQIRYPDLACATAANIGAHDDSWPYKEFRQGTANAKGMTLPISLGGWPDAFLERAMNGAAENKWINLSVGGEVRPEIQGNFPSAWPNGAGQVDNVKAAIELGHFSSSINEQGVGGYNANDANVQAIIRLMGYELYVRNAYFNNSVSGSFKVGVQIENRGVARFYYPWTMIVGLKDGSGNVVQTWNTSWDITKVQPLQIRAFPDWNVGADPTYLNFGYPMYYDTTISAAGLASGTYTVVLRVRNPLESITEASVRDNIQSWQPFLPAKKLRFANADQNADGWLSLGNISVGGGGPTWTPTRTSTPGAATPTYSRTPVSITPSNTPVGPTNTPTRTNTPITPTNTPTSGNGTSYEAEASGNTLAGGAVRASCGACSGGNKVGYVGNNSGTLQFNGINATSAGSTALTISYLSGEARSAQISVNGGAATTLNFASTGSWTTVGTLQTTVNLNAGGNTIKFSNSSGWAPDFDRIAVNTGGGPTNTPVPPTATRTNTPVVPTATRTNSPVPPTVTRTNTPGTPPPPTPTRTNTPVVPTATRTNTPVVPTATRTNTPVPPTVTPTAGAMLMIDSFSNSSKWSSKLNDLNKAISWVMDSIYYGDPTPGNIVMNSSPSGQYYQETIAQSLAGKTTLTLRLRDWSDTDTEAHWNIVLNDGTDHTVALNAYGNVTGSYTDINIPLSAFGANLANAQYLRIVHKDSTYAVLMIDAISAR